MAGWSAALRSLVHAVSRGLGGSAPSTLPAPIEIVIDCLVVSPWDLDAVADIVLFPSAWWRRTEMVDHVASFALDELDARGFAVRITLGFMPEDRAMQRAYGRIGRRCAGSRVVVRSLGEPARD